MKIADDTFLGNSECEWVNCFWAILFQGDSRIEVKSENNNLQLIVKGLVPKDSSNYTCKAKNKVGFIAANGTITVRCKSRIFFF